jgi:hypothetical protein
MQTAQFHELAATLTRQARSRARSAAARLAEPPAVPVVERARLQSAIADLRAALTLAEAAEECAAGLLLVAAQPPAAD